MSRLSEALRLRTKQFASATIRLYVNNKLHQESGELMAIFTTMVSKVRKAGSCFQRFSVSALQYFSMSVF